MNGHPRDSLPAFVLGLLGADAARQVAQHLASCPPCRADAEALRACVEIFTQAPHDHGPPPEIKRRLFAQIETSDRPRRRAGWPAIVAALALGLALALAFVALDARARIERQQQVIDYIAIPSMVGRDLRSAPQAPGAVGAMYMRPGRNQALLVVAGLPRLQSGQTYQCWVASAHGQAAIGVFNVDRSGAISMLLNAPEALNAYTQFMITIERAGGSATPSDQIVLSASL